jgi:FMN phosphatase YigB (HAD superfamily)
MRQYQWLLFDADGTLFDYDRAESAALQQVFRLIGATFDPGYRGAWPTCRELQGKSKNPASDWTKRRNLL